MVWYAALSELDFTERLRAVADALGRARRHLPAAVRLETGRALDEVLAGILPGLLFALGVVAASVALGGGVGLALGALLGGVGALPGLAAGAAGGLEAGVVVLQWLGLGFLAVHVGRSVGAAAAAAARGVRTAWDAVERAPGLRNATVDLAARELARGAAIVVRGVLEGIVAFLLARGVAGAAARVPELVAKLRASRLGAGFAVWAERNWAGLVEDARLRRGATAKPATANRSTAPTTSSASTTPSPATAGATAPASRPGAAPAATAGGLTPATAARLSEAGNAVDRGGYTRAGRALAKHGGREGSAFPRPSGSPADVNAAGRAALEDILRDPGAVVRSRTTGRFGVVQDVIAPDGRGARFGTDGTFIGFLEP